jgi:hypothetical protein
MQHAIDRVKIYAKESFDYKLYEIDLPCWVRNSMKI